LLAVQRAQENLQRLTNELASNERSLAQQDFAQIERESLVALRAEIHKLEFDPVQFSTIQSQLRSQRYIESKHAQLHRDLVELKRVKDQMPEIEARRDELVNTLAAESYGFEIRNQVHALQEQLVQLGYNSQNHADLKVRLTQLMSATEQYRQLKQAADELPALEEALSSCRALLQSKRGEVPLLTESLAAWREELKKLPQALAALEQQKPELTLARSQRDELAQATAVTRAKLEQLTARLDELTQKRSMSDELRHEIDDYVVLAEAFGKKGIQAVIIENAIPEIEAEANRLLARLSDNKMHVAFVTQQRTKTGGITETLDLLIGDEIGTRAYELYSGGEAFKVNFAIRVALSRLLARRSGAKLETLIIDEGFGSQDDASREKLVKAIRSIQPEFACILVITHMPDVREMFPVQIHVSKQRGSSELTILS
jgi:exonuclease SbcC